MHLGEESAFVEEVLVEEYRGDTLECVHCGQICGVGHDGQVKYAVGDTDRFTFLRSSGKPIQALPMMMSGTASEYRFTEKEIAVMIGSHRAEPFHVEALESLMAKTGIGEDRLVCAPTYPLSQAAAEALLRKQGEKRSIYHNCSGKHLGVLSLCKSKGYPLDNYFEPEHPAQQQILGLLAYLANFPKDQVHIGTDGCGFPVFAIPLKHLATVYMKLACPDLIEDAEVRKAVAAIVKLMSDHYEMIAGTNRICSSLLMDPNIVAKGGAKGVYCFGLKKERLGFALKVTDGSEEEWPIIVASILEQIGYGNRDTIDRLYRLAPLEIRNDNNKVIGLNKPVFRLAKR